MKNPLEGWNILTDILETEGIMKIGLYSKLARKELLEFKKKIDIKYKLRNVKGIKKLRHNIIHNNLIKLPNIFNSIVFFSKSGFKNLLLNEKKFQFDLMEIKIIINDLKLNFCGFQIKNDNIKDENFKLNEKFDYYNLYDWHYFEEKKYLTF